MASITKKIKKGRPYYYAVESKRVNGKPRIVWQKYLGTVEAIVERHERDRPPKAKEAVIFHAGGVAALLGITQQIGVMQAINDIVPKREQGPSVGHYMVLAALNRALAPCSKVGIGDWYQASILRRLWGFGKNAFSSQRFWDHMDRISEQAIDSIQERLAANVADVFGVGPGVLLYDTTNFFTFLSSVNNRSKIARRGHNKAKRHDLRQVGLALLASHEFQIPLFHRVYAGNIPDVTLFPMLAAELLPRYARLLGARPEPTLVFDKGNVSDEAMEQLVDSDLHFVAAVPLSRVPGLGPVPQTAFKAVPGVAGTRAAEVEAELWGRPGRAVICYTESFFAQQLSGVTQHMVKCQKRLLDLQNRLAKWHSGTARGKRPTLNAVRTQLREILSAQFMDTLFSVNLTEERGIPQLHYAMDHEALHRLTEQRLGRTLLVTSRTDWTPGKIITAYRQLNSVEQAFKNMKNAEFLHWQPAFHWTDQKVRVHGFYCVLALLLATLARKRAADAGIDLSIPAMLSELNGIREVALIYPPDTPGRTRDRVTISRMTPRQRRLADCLAIGEFLHSRG